MSTSQTSRSTAEPPKSSAKPATQTPPAAPTSKTASSKPPLAATTMNFGKPEGRKANSSILGNILITWYPTGFEVTIDGDRPISPNQFRKAEGTVLRTIKKRMGEYTKAALKERKDVEERRERVRG